MVNLFEISINILEEFIIALFMTLYFGCKYNRWKKYAGFLLVMLVAVSSITLINSVYVYEGFLGLLFILIYFLYALIFLNGDIYTKLFISGFINSIVYFIALFSNLCLSIVFHNQHNQIYEMAFERVVLIIMTKTLLAAACAVLLKFKFIDIGRRKNMVMLIVMPIVAEFSMIGIMQVFLQYDNLKLELLLASVSVMAANILTYYSFIRLNNDIKRESEFSYLQQEYESYKIYTRDIDELYNKMCGLRHDSLTHFNIILSLLESSVSEAKEYIQSITQNRLLKVKSLVKTDNNCFNAIVNAKIAVCEREEIKVQTRIMNNSLCRLSNDEIGILFGNLFDNAIEASRNSIKKSIELDVQNQGAYLSVFMINSIDNSVLINNENLYTTKSDKEYHGFGIKNIKSVVDGRGGIINYFEENGYFCCDILL